MKVDISITNSPSLVRAVEYPDTDPSSTLQLTSHGISESPMHQKEENGGAVQGMRHPSPTNTHGRNRKKRRMQEAEAAARENQIMKSASEEATVSKTEDNNKDTSTVLSVDDQNESEIKQEHVKPIKTKVSTKKRGRGRKSNKPAQQPETGPKQYVDKPTDNDILLGSWKFIDHPGNVKYRDLVRELRPTQKTSALRAEATQNIIDHIYNVIGGRFLKIDNQNRWELMPNSFVQTKVSKAIVEMRGKNAPVRTSPTIKVDDSALESLYKDQELTSTGRPKRKATVGPKVNDVTTFSEALSNEQKKKPKLRGSKKETKSKLPESKNESSKKPRRSGKQRNFKVEQGLQEYTYKPDPNQYYVEETAHMYHNPPFPSEVAGGVEIGDLRPIPPPPPLPNFPQNDTCQWSYNEIGRVVIADFSVGNNGVEPVVTLEDSKFLFEMLERSDITVISRGLLNTSKIDPSMWNLEYLRKTVGREFYHKFRRFDTNVDKNGIETCKEVDSLLSMRFEDYVKYCDMRERFMAKTSTASRVEEPTFTFGDHLGKVHNVGVGTSALYMIDVDINRLTPLLNKNFLESFELPSVLPGGSHCMMNSVTPDARPFMGPNLYVTPPASFTHFHQDGHGTVDSGHLCISGFNEVVMLRRLTERHKKHALWILSGKKPGGFHFDGLYSMPHGDGLGDKPSWPDVDMVEECRRMGYCPSVFTLEPGDLVHINKGRLHAFRKMSTANLPDSDCHAQLRRSVIESQGIAGEEKLCVSVAWDWMYRGVTPEGINREVSTVLEASTLTRQNGVTSLAIPELSLLQMAKAIPARSPASERGISFLGALEKRKGKSASIYDSAKEEICRGIYPALCVVVGQHVRALNVKESNSTQKGKRLSIAKIPDTQENPQTCPLDPYGNSDFQCKLCRKELSNVYFHCDGCENLLSKDFNICRGCHLQEKFRIKVQMHPSNPKRHATLNHMGDNKFDRQSRCPCRNGPVCNFCGFCLGCSCRCHTWFTMRTRLCNGEDEEKLLEAVKKTANVEQSTQTIVREAESFKRLSERLKAAGDEELLNDEKEDRVEGKEASEEKKDDTEFEANGYKVINGESAQEIDNNDTILI